MVQSCSLLTVTCLCRRPVGGADQAEEDEEAARGRVGARLVGGHAHAAPGAVQPGPRAAGHDRQAGGHAEAVQQEVLH